MIDKILDFLSSFFIDNNKERGIKIVDNKKSKKKKIYLNTYFSYFYYNKKSKKKKIYLNTYFSYFYNKKSKKKKIYLNTYFYYNKKSFHK